MDRLLSTSSAAVKAIVGFGLALASAACQVTREPLPISPIGTALASSSSELPTCRDKPRHGVFINELDAKPIDGDPDRQRLESPFAFVDAKGNTWVAPVPTLDKEWVWNGSSIPVVFQPFFGRPMDSCHSFASVPHDYFYQRADDHTFCRKAVDRAFYRGVRAKGIGLIKGKTMYYVLRAFGGLSFKRSQDPRSDKMLSVAIFLPAEQIRHVSAVEGFIRGENPDLDELDELSAFDRKLVPYLDPRRAAASQRWIK